MKPKKLLPHLYEAAMCMLAIFAVVLAILDLTTTLQPMYQMFDTIILYLFILDYFIRLFLASNKKQFVKSNIFDLIATILKSIREESQKQIFSSLYTGFKYNFISV